MRSLTAVAHAVAYSSSTAVRVHSLKTTGTQEYFAICTYHIIPGTIRGKKQHAQIPNRRFIKTREIVKSKQK